MSAISFQVEDSSFLLPHPKSVVVNWLNDLATLHHKTIAQLTLIFCSDNYLLQINREYLQHDYFTDIITFPYDTKEQNSISGDVFISIDRVRDNAKTYADTFERELYRVMAHGLLHLIGFGDKTMDDAKVMRQQEEEALAFAPNVPRGT